MPVATPREASRALLGRFLTALEIFRSPSLRRASAALPVVAAPAATAIPAAAPGAESLRLGVSSIRSRCAASTSKLGCYGTALLHAEVEPDSKPSAKISGTTQRSKAPMS